MAIVILGTDIFYPGSEFGIKVRWRPCRLLNLNCFRFLIVALSWDAQFGSMTVGLVAFCIIFAINSSVHSYLIVRYSEGNKVRGCCIILVQGHIDPF